MVQPGQGIGADEPTCVFHHKLLPMCYLAHSRPPLHAS